MAVVWTTVTTVVVLAAVIWISMYRTLAFRSISLGWKLLSLSGAVFLLFGIGFVLSWQPAAGPYSVGGAYPFGSYLKAWSVSMGFAMIAFAVLFAGFAILAAQVKRRWIWLALLFSWLVFWFPHAFIALSLILDGGFSLAALRGPELVVAGIGGVYLSVMGLGFFLSRKDGTLQIRH
jgi:hypothetical protein